MLARAHDDCRRAWARFVRPCERIGLERYAAGLAIAKFKLVDRAGCKAGHEQFPHARRTAAAHRMPSAVPAVEIADDARALGVRRPRRECDARYAVDAERVRTEYPVRFSQLAFIEEMEVDVRDARREAVGIVAFVARVIALPRDLVRRRRRGIGPVSEQRAR